MTYQEQIQSPKWQRKRLEIMQRDNFTCVDCGFDDRMLHVHHTLYVRGRMIWEYSNGVLTTLCDICHYYIHAEPADFIKLRLIN